MYALFVWNGGRDVDYMAAVNQYRTVKSTTLLFMKENRTSKERKIIYQAKYKVRSH